MAKKDIKVRYVQREPVKEELDPDVRSWNPWVYGCYKRLENHLLCNGGKCPNDFKVMAKICHCHKGLKLGPLSTGFHRVWPKISKKFQSQNGDIYIEEVSTAITEALRRMETARNKGKKGADARWHSHSRPIAKEKEKVKEKINNSYSENNCEISDSVSAKRSAACLRLCEIFHITTADRSNITTIRDVLNQVEAKIRGGVKGIEIFDLMVDEARGCYGRARMGKFINIMKGEPFGYVPKRRGFVK